MSTELVLFAFLAHGRWLVVLDAGVVAGGLVRDVVEVLTSFCARLDGRRPIGRGKQPGAPPEYRRAAVVGAVGQDGES